MSNWEELRNAILTGSGDSVRIALGNKPSGTKPSGEHLVLAIKKGLPNIVGALLYAGAEIRPSHLTDAIDDEQYGLSIVNSLIEYGARPTFEDLEIAVKKGSPDMVKLLLDTNAEDPSSLIFDTITSDNKYGLSIVAILLEYGAIPTCHELEAAINSGSPDMVKLILEKVDITPDSLKLAIWADTQYHTSIVDLLIEYGAIPTSENFETAINNINILSLKTLWDFIPCDKMHDVFDIAVKNHRIFSEGFQKVEGIDPYGKFKNKSFEILELFTIIPTKKQIESFPEGSEAFDLLQSRYDFAILILSEFIPRDICCLILEY